MKVKVSGCSAVSYWSAASETGMFSSYWLLGQVSLLTPIREFNETRSSFSPSREYFNGTVTQISCVNSLLFPRQKSPCLKFGLPLCPGVGQQRLMPHGLYAQEKACKQEERLLERLQSIDLDPTLLRVLQRQVTLLLEGEWLL